MFRTKEGGVVVYKRGDGYFVNKILSTATANLKRYAASACYLCVLNHWRQHGGRCTTDGGTMIDSGNLKSEVSNRDMFTKCQTNAQKRDTPTKSLDSFVSREIYGTSDNL